MKIYSFEEKQTRIIYIGILKIVFLSWNSIFGSLFSFKTHYIFLIHWGWVTHICVGNLTIVGSYNGWLAPSHFLSQCWNVVNWTLRNKLQWNFNQNSCIFIKENAFHNVVCKIAPILFRPQCVKMCSFYFNLYHSHMKLYIHVMCLTFSYDYNDNYRVSLQGVCWLFLNTLISFKIELYAVFLNLALRIQLNVICMIIVRCFLTFVSPDNDIILSNHCKTQTELMHAKYVVVSVFC